MAVYGHRNETCHSEYGKKNRKEYGRSERRLNDTLAAAEQLVEEYRHRRRPHGQHRRRDMRRQYREYVRSRRCELVDCPVCGPNGTIPRSGFAA